MQGLTVAQVQKLRKGIAAKGKMCVAKNTLLKRATRDIAGAEQLEPYFKDQIALIFAHQDAPAVAKVVHGLSEETDKLKVLAGYLDKRVVDASKVKFIATLPSKEVLIARLAGLLKSPVSRLAFVLKEISTKQS
jgi:large subunit ribosomal protein L10